MAKSTAGLAHHFDDREQQFDAAGLGTWIFLATEIMFFGGLFAGYMVYRFRYPTAFIEGSHHLDLLLGGINTVVLICSSLTMVLAVHSAQKGRPKAIAVFLILTIILGGAFLGIKAFEYSHKYHEGLVPGLLFGPEGDHAPNLEMFFAFYFCMTGLHAAHMVVGIGLLAFLVVFALKRRYSAEYYTPVEMCGLYWHFVDIIWIFLFPLLYLIGRHH